MAKYLRQVSIMTHTKYPDGLRLNREGLPVTYLYNECLGKYEAGGVAKVTFRATPISACTRTISADDGAVLVLDLPFDFDRLLALPEGTERQRVIADFVHQSLVEIARERGWNEAALDDARRCVLSRLMKRQVWPNSPLWNPTRTGSAQVEYEIKPDMLSGWAVFRDQSGLEVCTKRLFGMQPSELDLQLVLGRLTWKSADSVQLESRDKRRKWEATCKAAPFGAG